MKQFALLVVGVLAFACGSSRESGTRAAEAPVVTRDEHGEPVGLHRHRRWSERIGQGAQPEGEEAFRNLAALGYTTVLSVDGAAPDVETAAKYGLAYVHVPIGYDGVAPEEQVEIVKAVKESPGPVYFHCHHGKHRGPAAAMVARISVDGISHEEALKGLEISETSPGYEGLWRDVRECEPPSAEAIAAAPKPPSRVLPQGVRAMMVGVGTRFDFLKASQEAAWKSPPGHPDVSPPHEARMLWELYREMARLDESKAKGAEFVAFTGEAEKLAKGLEDAIRAGNAEEAGRAMRGIKKNCDACHSQFRD